MNKIISANINGFVFSIDEKAYEKLSQYLDSIRRKGMNHEVMTDIENRIAELFDYKIKNGKPAILDEDVVEIMAQIGSPEELGSEEGSQSEQTQAKSENNSYRSHRRLYRNEDDKIIGGVCSGIAAYFRIDPMFIRIGFAASFFMFGTGFLLYIFLMIILPKAVTPAEKLEMRGDAVDFKNLSKTIERDFKDAYHRYRPEVKTGFERFLEILVKVGAVILILFLISLFLPVSLGIFTSIGVVSWALPLMSEFIFISSLEATLFIIGLVLFFIVPLGALLYKVAQIIFKFKPMGKLMSVLIGVLWFTGFCMIAYVTYRTGNDFSHAFKVKESEKLHLNSQSRTLIIKGVGDNTDRFFDEDDFEVHLQNSEDLKEFINKSISSNVRLSISRGFEPEPVLHVIKQSSGGSKEDAMNFAKGIEYSYVFKDSVLLLDKFLSVDENQLWRNQNVRLVLELPENYEVYVDRSCHQIFKESRYSKRRKRKVSNSMYNKKLYIDEDGYLHSEKTEDTSLNN